VAATLLGFIPGVGAIYNGQVVKGLIHVLIFAGLVSISHHVGFLGVLVAFFYFYMVWDAYATAKAIQEGRPLPDPFGLAAHLPASETSMPASPGPGSELAEHCPRIPTAAIVLIGLGVLFLLDNLGVFHWYWLGRTWPIILIAIGVWLFAPRRWFATAVRGTAGDSWLAQLLPIRPRHPSGIARARWPGR
jgi:TM2 domain-containing membrane protein YozV